MCLSRLLLGQAPEAEARSNSRHSLADDKSGDSKDESDNGKDDKRKTRASSSSGEEVDNSSDDDFDI